jgi:rod shape-determining protein MreC
VDPLSGLVRLSIQPVALPIGKVFIQIGEFGSGVFQARALFRENQALKAEMIGFQAYSQRVDLLNDEIEGYRKQLQLPSTARKPVNLDVIGISQSDGSLILNGGTELGIRPDLPVVNGDGLVGIVQTSSHGESRVAMLTAYGLKVFGVDSSRQPPEEGLISGNGNSTLTMRMLIPKDPVASGDTILTSLKSRNIPGGLVVGRVISVEDDPYDGTHRLTLDPAVNLGTLHQVQVLE